MTFIPVGCSLEFEKQMKAVMELGGVLWEPFTGLFNWCKVHAGHLCKLEKNLRYLQSKSDTLQRLRSDVESRINEAEARGEHRTNEVIHWLQQVENLLDELDDIQNKGSEETQNKCFRGCCRKNCLSSYKLDKKVVKMFNEVDELAANGRRFANKDVIIAHKLLDKVWSCLQDRSVGVVGLYGMGGAGKTTLLKRIHNEFGKRKHGFEIVLLVVVSRDQSIDKIMSDIAKGLRIRDRNWYGDRDEKAAKIDKVLKKKKYVLMLDDLREELDLNKVGVQIPQGGEYQSKVLFTTPSQDVCYKMNAQKKFELKCLSEDEAFNLFRERVGEETLKHHVEIQNLAGKIVKKCNGYPLALVTVGSSMCGVTNIESWMQAESSLRSYHDIAWGVEKDVFPILKFSYHRLPNQTYKKCFLYCSLYPEECEIPVDDVIYRWIGEGFLGGNKSKNSVHDMYVEGKSIIEKLKLSCLLEDVVLDEVDSSPSMKMRDVIREMALWLFRYEDGSKEKVIVEGKALALRFQMDSGRLGVVERISITKVDIDRWQVPACPNLITLCARFNIIDCSNLQCMTKLKVLDLAGFESKHLPLEIGQLINLEFLNLSKTEIENRFPIELKKLTNLRVLLMEEVSFQLELIPVEVIGSLERLKVLRFSTHVLFYLFNYQTFPGEVEEKMLEKLESLTELEEVCIELTTIAAMRKLLESAKLRSCATHFYVSRMKAQLEMASVLETLSMMMHLNHIRLRGVGVTTEASSVTDTYHLDNLRTVTLWSCDSITHLTWLRYAPLLEYLHVGFCNSIEEVVKDDVGSDKDDTDNDIFPNLTHLRLVHLSKLKSIHNKALCFPFLKFIQVYDCPNLRKLPLNSNSAKDTLIQIEGECDWWNNLEWEDPTLEHKFYPKSQLF